jgi:Domain of unknown function (DUF4824)
MRKRGLLMALGLLLLANALVLSGVWYNRSGAPDSVMTLTDREMPVAYNYPRENSGMSLTIRTYQNFYGGSVTLMDDPLAWLDRKKLETLGFDFTAEAGAGDPYGFRRRHLPRRAYAVLEYDGPAWERWKGKLIAELTKADRDEKEGKKTTPPPDARRKSIGRALATDSHLFIIDAGKDAAALRRRYPDQKHYLILPAKVRVSSFAYAAAGKDAIRGSVELLTPEVNVPHRLHSKLVKPGTQIIRFGMRAAGTETEPRYQVLLRTGRRFEPWIEDVIPIR